jgi:hypothetical protein
MPLGRVDVSASVNPDKEIEVHAILRAVPVRNKALRTETRGKGNLMVYVPLRKRWFMRLPFSWLLRFSNERAVALDALGAEVWEACDGQATAEQIVEKFAANHRLSFHEARLSVMEFLRQLTRRGMIVMVGKENQT